MITFTLNGKQMVYNGDPERPPQPKMAAQAREYAVHALLK
jgi:hypothetical protein